MMTEPSNALDDAVRQELMDKADEEILHILMVSNNFTRWAADRPEWVRLKQDYREHRAFDCSPDEYNEVMERISGRDA